MGCIDFRREGSKVERLKNINDTVLTDGFLYYDIPAIVSDSLKDWPRTEDGELKLSTDKIKQVVHEIFQLLVSTFDAINELAFFRLRLSRFFRTRVNTNNKKMDIDGEKGIPIGIAVRKIVIQGYPAF